MRGKLSGGGGSCIRKAVVQEEGDAVIPRACIDVEGVAAKQAPGRPAWAGKEVRTIETADKRAQGSGLTTGGEVG